MSEKILRIIFNGISTLYPGPPTTRGEKSPEKAFVLMAANREVRTNDWDAPIEPHFPFIYVPKSMLGGTIPQPADWVDDKELGTCYIYYLDNARVTVDATPLSGVHYYTDDEHDLDERPGSNDVANENDIRWLASLSTLLSAPVELRSSLTAPGPEVAAIVELQGGEFRAGFPCKSVQPKTFKAAQGRELPGLRRVLASEFSVEMSFAETTSEVTLQLWRLRDDAPPAGLTGNQLVLRWPEAGPLVVRMGNDTRTEVRMAASVQRCTLRNRDANGKPILRPRDDDFFLHYELLNISPNAGRPLPQEDVHQTSGDGCKPAG